MLIQMIKIKEIRGGYFISWSRNSLIFLDIYVHYRAYKSQPLDYALSHIIPVRIFTYCSYNIHVNIILSTSIFSPSGIFPSGPKSKIFYCI
jgi:hypothetical protein